jgi:hypothetical protein
MKEAMRLGQSIRGFILESIRLTHTTVWLVSERSLLLPLTRFAKDDAEISANMSLEIELRDTLGAVLRRAWQGYEGSLDAANRVPVQYAWRALGKAATESTVVQGPEPEDRALLSAAWLHGAGSFERPWYALRALLILAARAGSPELIAAIVKQLDSEDTEVQRLAVDALAAITGRDVGRDASGSERTLSDLVADYQRECTKP